MTIKEEEMEILGEMKAGCKKLDELELAIPRDRNWIRARLQYARMRGWIKATGKKWRLLKGGRRVLALYQKKKEEESRPATT